MKCQCGGLELYKLYEDLDFYKCKACALVQRYPMPTPAQLTKIYEMHYSSVNITNNSTCQSSNDFAVQNYANLIKSKLLLSSGRHLDYGCGEGKLVLKLQRIGLASYGFDEFHTPSGSVKGFINNYDELSGSNFDVITLIEVIEHFDDLDFHLKRIYSLLRPGGLLFITTPNIAGLKSMIKRNRWNEITKDFHLYFFNAKSMKIHLQRNGFSLIEICNSRPLTKDGFWHRIYVKIVQFLNLDGTLAVVCRK